MITLQKESFLKAIKAVKTCCGKIGLQPILSTIHLKSENGGLTLTGTDINNSARAIIEANVSSDINICVNAEKLDAIVSCLQDTITLNIEDAFLIIKSGNTKFDLLWLNSDEFPVPDFKLTDNPIVLNTNSFVSGINKTIFATQQVDGHILNGICLTLNNDNFEFASTDGSRLCQIKFDIPIGIEGQYILPRKILLDILKIVKNEIELHIKQNKITFKTDNFLFTGALLTGSYPKYEKLIPTNNNKKIEINKNELLHSLETVAIMVNDKINVCNFKFTNNKLELNSACDNGKSKDFIEIKSNIKDEFNTAFNYRYFIEGLKAIDSETVVLNMGDNLKPCIIKDGENYTQLIMPCNFD